MGSVKDVKILAPAFENVGGSGEFDFSDRYSVFDWGEMPDHIVNKGAALAVMAAFNFEQLAKRGIPSHYRGLDIRSDKLMKVADLEGFGGSDRMEFDLAVRSDPVARTFMGDDGNPRVEYDYSFFQNNRGQINNYLVPLEIIFRNGTPRGSSVFKKIKAAKAIGDPVERQKTLQKIYSKLGLKAAAWGLEILLVDRAMVFGGNQIESRIANTQNAITMWKRGSKNITIRKSILQGIVPEMKLLTKR